VRTRYFPCAAWPCNRGVAREVPPTLTVGPIRDFYIFTKVDFCTRIWGQLLPATHIRGAGNVNSTSENGLFDPTVRVLLLLVIYYYRA